MAHMLDRNVFGRIPMAYVGATPWHGLGQQLQAGADIETWKIQAGLDWTINASHVKYTDQYGTIHTMPGQVVLHRSDDNSPLSVVSERYKVVQPEEVIEFYRDLTEAHGYELETAGSLGHGKKVWALAKTGMGKTLKGRDEINNYLLLATACDGSMATRAQFTSVRVVCNNTLSAALRNADNAIKVPHSTKFNADQVKSDLGIVRNSWDEFGDIIDEMSRCRVTPKDAAEVIFDLLKSPSSKTIDDESRRNKNIMREVMTCVARSPGAGLESADGTAWGLLNGITYYVDHKANSRSNDNRLNSAWFGKGATLKDKAFQRVAELVDAKPPAPTENVFDLFPNLNG
ncbi:MAG: DUF932 domain-containing protein [Gammaproteobacteria bacterium]|nr:DUF932 domain-containing protein [Gammaproteobacteria bacterium]